jgi:hydrogenase maturation protein HypF
MGSLETHAAFERSTLQFKTMYQVDPLRVTADAHPGYQTRRWADERSSRPVDLVQHHHAHVAAVMAEHGLEPDARVIGFAFDGTGYGTDGAIWGGEVLIASYAGFERAAHLRYVPMPGGDATIRKPYRAALSHLWAAGIEWAADLDPVLHASQTECTALQRQLERNAFCTPTSSMGRLFDAVSSLLGLRHEASYEAQAAMELEWCAQDHMRAARPCPLSYQFGIVEDEIDPAPLLRAIIDDRRNGRPVGAIAAGFHVAVAGIIAEMAERLRTRTATDRTPIDQIALSGGVFQNLLLQRLARAELATLHFQVLTHSLVPPNDAGLALGQAVVAACTDRGGA